ncbi:MAG: T9SS type A sorting domain-containing protein [Bacteroidia bacterium]
MKQLIIMLTLFCFVSIAGANDLNFSVVNTTTGGSNGSIDMTVSGGVASFTYNWIGPAGFTATTEDLTGLAAGTYIVNVTDMYCGVATDTVIVYEITGIAEINKIVSFLVFPNPGNGQITLRARLSLNNATFKLINVFGETVVKEYELNGTDFVFDISKQAAGIYFIEIKNEEIFSRIRFVKN